MARARDITHTTEYLDGIAEAVLDDHDRDGEPLFQVTAVIGTVTRGGRLSPRMAAFMLIAEAGIDGEYSFPLDGKTINVGVWTAEAPIPVVPHKPY